MGMVHCGIVLKSFFHKEFCILFDLYEGKIKSKIKSGNIYPMNGSFLNYELVNEGRFFCIKNIKFLNNPVELGKENIFFMHMILEIVDTFQPYSGMNVEIYDFILYYLENYKKLNLNISRKIFLCKLFVILGIHPDFEGFSEMFFTFITLPIDTALGRKIDLNFEKMLDRCMDFGINSLNELRKTNASRFYLLREEL